ncbi:MAG: PIN domain-containing protein [bacterium]
MTLIDTSAWIEFLRPRGRPEVKHRVAACLDLGEAAYCGPIEFELLSGARESEMPHIREVFRFSACLDFPAACWQRAAQIGRDLRAQGVTIPRDDLFVAAAALHHDVALYACDQHFTLVRDTTRLPLRLL